ncbi:hypothetical protein [Neolewinella agarilytica]|uniref:hypothetical protein n=1 Tax=Neolewinella agarilytica TaxID=478744 RepID=UPI002355AF7A|nr:hypothetical protein [Neolewinella agarilytica]
MKNIPDSFFFPLIFLLLFSCDPNASGEDMMMDVLPVDLILTGDIREATTGEPLTGWIVWAQNGRNLNFNTLLRDTAVVRSDGSYRLEIGHFSENTDTRGMSAAEIIAAKEDFYNFSSVDLLPPEFADRDTSIDLRDCFYAGIDVQNRYVYYGGRSLDFSQTDPPLVMRNVNAHTNSEAMAMRIELSDPPSGSHKVVGQFMVKDDGYNLPFFNLRTGAFFTEDHYETSTCVPADRPFTLEMMAIFYDENDPLPRIADTLIFRDTILQFDPVQDTLIIASF